MTEKSFLELVHQHFDFLVREYGFHLSGESQTGDLYDHGFFEYESPTTNVVIKNDRQDILVLIKPRGAPEIARRGIEDISEAITGTSSQMVEGIRYPIGLGVSPERYDETLRLYARMMAEDCSSFLRGDFSQWKNILRSYVEKRKKDYHQRIHRELPERIFKELVDYINSID